MLSQVPGALAFFLALFLAPYARRSFGIAHDLGADELSDFQQQILDFDKHLPPIGGYQGDASDVKYLVCETCQGLVNQTLKLFTKKISKIEKGSSGSLGEDDILDLFTSICDVKHKHGRWITHYDVLEPAVDAASFSEAEQGNGDQNLTEDATYELKLKRYKKPGRCKGECRTIALACSKVYPEVADELAETLYSLTSTVVEYVNRRASTSMTPQKRENGKDSTLRLLRAELQHQLCATTLGEAGMEGACGKPYPALSVSERLNFNEKYERKTEQDIVLDELNRQLKTMNFRDEL